MLFLNMVGCYSVSDVICYVCLGWEVGLLEFVKLEVIGDE